jgi:hypothetical protein
MRLETRIKKLEEKFCVNEEKEGLILNIYTSYKDKEITKLAQTLVFKGK